MYSDAQWQPHTGENFGRMLGSRSKWALDHAFILHKNFKKVGCSGYAMNNPEGQVQLPPTQDEVGCMTFEAFLDRLDICWDQAFLCSVSKSWSNATMAYAKEKMMGDFMMAEQWII